MLNIIKLGKYEFNIEDFIFLADSSRDLPLEILKTCAFSLENHLPLLITLENVHSKAYIIAEHGSINIVCHNAIIKYKLKQMQFIFTIVNDIKQNMPAWVQAGTCCSLKRNALEEREQIFKELLAKIERLINKQK